VVTIANDGDVGLRLWHEGNSWGDPALYFELYGAGEVANPVIVRRRPQAYTRNVPSSFVLGPGKTVARPFDLSDADWDAGGESGAAPEGGARLVAVYEIPPTPETATHDVWTGQLRSREVDVRP
jgi:hypothetical protein